jgi:hypothetical protein
MSSRTQEDYEVTTFLTGMLYGLSYVADLKECEDAVRSWLGDAIHGTRSQQWVEVALDEALDDLDSGWHRPAVTLKALRDRLDSALEKYYQ